MSPFRRLFSSKRKPVAKPGVPPDFRTDKRPLPYSWIITSRLAIGPMPRSEFHWQQLEEAGFRGRFSCCYPEEEIFAPVPEHWLNDGFSLPDHRDQEDLQPEMLEQAIKTALNLLSQSQPIYMHCLAGKERSSLMATALVATINNKDLFDALEWVRRCHPSASPIYSHLDVLEQILKQNRQ
jgi:hypothetical protein